MKTVFEKIVLLVKDLRTLEVMLPTDVVRYEYSGKQKLHLITIKRNSTGEFDKDAKDMTTIEGLFREKFENSGYDASFKCSDYLGDYTFKCLLYE